MKKVVVLIIVLLSLASCRSADEKKILDDIKKVIPNDNFYFIRGLDRERSFATNIRYRGIIYSDKLKEAKSKMGIEIALESLSSLEMYKYEYKRKYENALAYPKAEKYVRDNAKKIFGEDIIVYVTFPMIWDLKGQVDFIEQNIGKKTEEIANAYAYIDVFVDDVEKINTDEYKKKLFNLHKTLYNQYNYEVKIDLYLKEKKYLTYKEIERRVFYLYKNEPKVKELLKRLKRGKELSPKEIGYLMDYFVDTLDCDLPCLLFPVRESDKSYQDIRVGHLGYKNRKGREK